MPGSFLLWSQQLEHFPAKWNPVSRKEMLLTKPASTFA